MKKILVIANSQSKAYVHALHEYKRLFPQHFPDSNIGSIFLFSLIKKTHQRLLASLVLEKHIGNRFMSTN